MMPSIKKRVTGFIRQISGPSQSGNRTAPVSPPPQYEKCFIQRYLAGEGRPKQPDIHHAKTGHSLPVYALGYLQPEVFAAFTGPEGGLTCISRSKDENEKEKLSAAGDVDYIDIEDGRMSTTASRRASIAAEMVQSFELNSSERVSIGVDRTESAEDIDTIRELKSPNFIDNSIMTIRVMDRIYRVDSSQRSAPSPNSSTGEIFPVGYSHEGITSIVRGSVSHGSSSTALYRKHTSSTQSCSTPARGSLSSTIGSTSSCEHVSSPLFQTSDAIDIDDHLELIETEDGYLPVRSIQSSEITPESKRITISSPVRSVSRPNFLNLAPSTISFSSQPDLESRSHNNENESTTATKKYNPRSRINFEKSNISPCQEDKSRFNHTTNRSSISNTGDLVSSQKENCSKINKDYPELQSTKVESNICSQNTQEQNKDILAKLTLDLKDDISISIAGVRHWNRPNGSAYGVSDSLYERNPATYEQAGHPIADTFAVVARKNSAILVLGDGVNWGPKAALASRAAVYGAMEYLNTALFGVTRNRSLSTQDVFQILLRSFHAAHCLILEQDAMLTTLTAAVLLPTEGNRFHFCVCNVGDSLAYVYSNGEVREVTQGSHDITANRDMRDALGALGPVDGLNPELSNLTCSITEVLPGDIVFLTSDGISDNFDPVVGKFCIPKKPERTSSLKGGPNIPRGRRVSDSDFLPTVEGFQRHELTLLRIEDILNHDWGSNSILNSGCGRVNSAAELCQRMLDFCQRLTTAKRKILEDPELYPEHDQDMQDQKLRRRKVCEKLALVPGKLDHATICAYQVGDRTQELSDYKGDMTDLVGRNTPGLTLSAPRASCEDLSMRDSPDSGDDVTPTPSISLDSTPLASGASSLAATPTRTPRSHAFF